LRTWSLVDARRSIPFVLHQFGAALRSFFHEKTHLRMTRFQIHSNALLLQLGGGNGADRADNHARQSAN